MWGERKVESEAVRDRNMARLRETRRGRPQVIRRRCLMGRPRCHPPGAEQLPHAHTGGTGQISKHSSGNGEPGRLLLKGEAARKEGGKV